VDLFLGDGNIHIRYDVRMPDAGELVRETRTREGLDQAALARRAGTTQAQVSRIERGQISPSAATVKRLMAAMGERLELESRPLRSNVSTAELRRDYVDLTASERFDQAIRLSRTLTALAAAGARQRGRVER
jgi:transcriptional regulator with XRE-family HTH domain